MLAGPKEVRALHWLIVVRYKLPASRAGLLVCRAVGERLGTRLVELGQAILGEGIGWGQFRDEHRQSLPCVAIPVLCIRLSKQISQDRQTVSLEIWMVLLQQHKSSWRQASSHSIACLGGYRQRQTPGHDQTPAL